MSIGRVINKITGNVGIADGANLDAFSRLRVSNPTGLFEVQSQYDEEPLLLELGATGTGVTPAHDANARMKTLSCTAGTGTSYIQSYQYFPYQPGKSQLIETTFVIGAAVAAAVVDVGYFDANNGIFFRQDGTTGLAVVRRTKTSGSVVDNAVVQSSWNIDKLDGTGKSGITLDITKSQIFAIDLQFLGMGRVRCYFDIGGQLIPFHEFLNANTTLAVPYMQTASLPVQMLITATSTASTKNSYFKCAAVLSEGGTDGFGYRINTPEATVTAASGADTHIVSVRPKTTFNSQTNRQEFVLKDLNIIVTGNSPVSWKLCIGSTFSVNPTWADVNATYSGFEYGTGGTLSGAGLVIAGGYISSSAQSKGAFDQELSAKYPICLDRAGAVRANGTLSLLVYGIGGTSACRAMIGFEEIR